MHTIELLSSGIVFRNPQPAVRSLHAYFPTAVELPNGEILVGMDLGSAFEAVDVRSYISRSTDGAASWSKPELLFRPDESRGRVSTTCRIGHVHQGELVGWACLFDRTLEDCGLGNPEVEGFCRTDFATVRSNDGGKSWSPPTAAKLPTHWQHFENCAPPYRVGDDRLLTLTSPWASWDGETSPWGHNGMAFASTDNGHTWDEIVQIFQDDTGNLSFFEQAFARLSDGRLAVMSWVYDRKQGRNAKNHIAFSDDDGHTFGPAIETPLCGETSRPLGLPGNRLLVVYRRTDKKGLWAHLAQIDGDRWLPLGDLPLWGGAPAAVAGEQHGTLAQMSNLKFGCPAILQLRGGEVFVVFWCVEDCVSNIRWLKLRVD
jgi:sialidase-1